MKMERKRVSFSHIMIVMAAVIVVLAGVKAAASILVPFLLSLFLAIILMPALQLLRTKKVPTGLALTVVLVALILLIGMVGMLVAHALSDFTVHLPEYEGKLRALMGEVLTRLDTIGITLPERNIQEILDPGLLFGYLTVALKGFGSMLTNGFVIVLTTVFMMLEAVTFREKIVYLNHRKGQNGDEHLTRVLEKINHYMGLKALISLGTGALVYVMLLFFGLDYAVLWAVVAFLFNFIPNIGSIIAAVPALLLALIQLDLSDAFWIAGGYVLINTLVGSVLEPKVMGKGLDLSTLVVFLSLIFWGWLLGPVGMLLSIPLTIMVKIVFASAPQTMWIAVLLGGGSRDLPGMQRP